MLPSIRASELDGISGADLVTANNTFRHGYRILRIERSPTAFYSFRSSYVRDQGLCRAKNPQNARV